MRTRWRITSLVWIMGLLAASSLVLWPLARPGFFISDDGEWMIIRLSAFWQSLRDGQLPVRFLDRLNHGYGYPVANFLYPGFLYLGSLIHVLGFSFVDSVKLVLAGSIVGSALLLYGWLRTTFGAAASFIGSVTFLFAPYLLFDLYQRGSVGEVLSYFAATLSLYSIDRPVRWLFPFAVALLLISHNSLALIFSLFLACYLFIRKKQEFWIPYLLGFGMASFFWIPAFWERRFVVFDSQLIARSASYVLDNGKWFLLPVSSVAAALLILINQTLRKNPLTVFFLVVFAASIWLATSWSLPVWNIPSVSMVMQFPYRFLALALIAGSWLVAQVIDRIAVVRAAVLVVLFGVFGVSAMVQTARNIVWVVREEGYYATNEATTTVADEYMPRWVQEKPTARAVKKLEFISGKGTVNLEKYSTRRIEATVEAEEEGVLRANTMYYPGWGAEVDGMPVPIQYKNPTGAITVAMPVGRHRLTVEFRETPLRLFADTVSVVSVLAALVIGWRQILKRFRGRSA